MQYLFPYFWREADSDIHSSRDTKGMTALLPFHPGGIVISVTASL